HLGGGFNGAEYRSGAIRVELRSLFNPQLTFERALAGVFIPAILHLFILGGAAYAIGREFRDRTAGQWIEIAHRGIVPVLVGKLLPLTIVFAAMALSFIAWFAGYRGWQATGSATAWAFGVLTLEAACIAIAAMFVGLTGSLRMSLGITAILNVTAV